MALRISGVHRSGMRAALGAMSFIEEEADIGVTTATLSNRARTRLNASGQSVPDKRQALPLAAIV